MTDMDYPRNKSTKPIKAVLHHTRSNEMISSELYKIIQRVFVDNKDYFQVDRSQVKGNPLKNEDVKAELAAKIHLDKVPVGFKENFKLNYSSPDIKNQIVDIFADATSLNRMTGEQRSDRVVFSKGNIVISKNESHPVHIDKRKYTQGEKKLSNKKTTLLTFPTIYDALRSQYHAIENIGKDKEKSLSIFKDILQLSEDIKESFHFSKDDALKRKLNDIIQSLGEVRDFNKLSAKLYQLEQLSNNKSIASKQLEGSANKFIQRFDAIGDMLGEISFRDIPKLEKILSVHEDALTMFLAQISFVPNQEFVFSEYRKRLAKLTPDHLMSRPDQAYFDWNSNKVPEYLNISPFGSYYQRILAAYETKNPDTLKSLAKQIEAEFESIKSEHNEKLNLSE